MFATISPPKSIEQINKFARTVYYATGNVLNNNNTAEEDWKNKIDGKMVGCRPEPCREMR